MTNKQKVFNNTFRIESKHLGEYHYVTETHKFNDIIIIAEETSNVINCIGRIVQIRKGAGKNDYDLVLYSRLDQTIGCCDSIYIRSIKKKYLPLFEEMFSDVEKEPENRSYIVDGADTESGYIIPVRSILKRSKIEFFFGETQKFDIYTKKCPKFCTKGIDQATPKIPVLLTKRDEHMFIKDILYDDVMSHCCYLVEYDFIHARYYGVKLNSFNSIRAGFPLLPELSFKVGKIIGMTSFEHEELTNQSEFFIDFVNNNNAQEIVKVLGINEPKLIADIEYHHANNTLLRYLQITNIDGYLLEFEFYKLYDFSYSGDNKPITFQTDANHTTSKYLYSESYEEILYKVDTSFKHHLQESSKTN